MKKKMTKAAVLLLSLALVMGLFASCGGGGSDTEGKTSLVVAVDNDYATLHPCNWSTTVEQRMNSQIYDTLLRKNYEDQTKLEPRVAEKWEVSKDGKCYTFHLRDDVTFHDGSKLTAEDIGFTLDLYAKSEYQGAVVEGFDHYDIVDDTTIKVYTKSVYAPFLDSMDQMFIASKAYYEKAGKDKFAQEPVGCGPYKWVSHEDGNKADFEAYEDYYRGEPKIKNVTFKIISDVASMGVGIQTGEVDFAEVDPSVVSTIKDDENVALEEATETTFGFVAMNTEKAPYNNVKFRQAINYAIDRQGIIDSVQEGYATENSNLLTPDRLGWSKDQKSYTYDLDKAKALLKEAGIKGEYDLGKMYVAEQYKSLAEVVQANLEKVGLKCKIEILEFNAYLNKLRQGDFGITTLQMSLEGDTQQVAMALCSQYVGQANNARYSNPEIDQLFEKAVTTIKEEDRAKVYDEIFQKVQEEAVYAVLYNPTMLYARNAGLKIHHLPVEGVYYIYDFSW
ncbi:Dipeptide-binding protein [uncultured Eubacterium sp.]|uniref:ABC transporter substrate-binding protein n=1 Tax=Emergencia sp. TaxID=1926557 RepID=UPI0008221734|nr:Dipeptide-binding protein [uncultured Eubacterium sp.]